MLFGFWLCAHVDSRCLARGYPLGSSLDRLVKRGSHSSSFHPRRVPRAGRYPLASAIWYNANETDGQQQINQVHASLKPTLFLWDWPDWCFVFSCLSHFSDPLSIRLRPSSDIRYPLCSYCDSIFLNR